MSKSEIELKNAYIAEIRRMPLLSAEEELKLIQNWKMVRHEPSKDKLILSYLKLILPFARKLPPSQFFDVMQTGTVGLLKALKKFELERGVRFMTFAIFDVREQIKNDPVLNKYVVQEPKTASYDRVKSFLMKSLKKVAGEKSEYTSADLKLAAEDLGVAYDHVERRYILMQNGITSLHSPIGEGGTEFGDLIEDPYNPDTAIIVEDSDHLRYWSNKLENAFLDANLTDRERDIFTRRKLCEGKSPTLDVLGDEYGLSKERIRQLEKSAFMKLKCAMISAVGVPVPDDSNDLNKQTPNDPVSYKTATVQVDKGRFKALVKQP